MLRETSPQIDFIDQLVFARLPTGETLVKIKRVIDFQSLAKPLEDFYVKQWGRPAYPITMMLAILFIEYYHNLSDREIVRQLQYNFLYRWFADLSFSDAVPDDTSLVVFRKRIGEEGLKAVFDEIIKQAKAKGVLKERIKAVDATHMVANAAVNGVINFLRQARNKIIRLFKKDNPEAADKLVGEYGDNKKFFGKPKRGEVKKEVEKTRAFLAVISGLCSERVLWWVKLLEETLGKIVCGITEDLIGSFVDVDARWGHKTKEKVFFGYKVHTVQDESRIVTSVEVLPGNTNEGVRLLEILQEDKRKGISGEGVVADKLYDSGANRKGVRGLGMVPYILSNTQHRKFDQFEYDLKNGLVRCRAGCEPIGWIPQERGRLYYFSVKDCRVCKLRKGCLRRNELRQRVYLSDCELERLRVGKAVIRQEAKRLRAQIEPKYGEGKVWHGLGRARYRGRWRVAIQAMMTFVVMNAKRLVKLLGVQQAKAVC